MLIKCPECNHDISDKAEHCPNCGYPMRSSPKTYKKSNRRRRLPNGFGQITRLNNPNLRKPFRAMFTVSKDEYGKPICKLLKPVSYFETYNEAYQALLEYHQNPSLASRTKTLGEVYDEWSAISFEEYPKRVQAYQNSWKYVSRFRDVKMNDIRTRHIADTMEYDNPTQAVCREFKGLWNKLFKYAMQYGYAEKNYAEVFTMPKAKRYAQPTSAHSSFTDEDMDKLRGSELIFAKIMLFQCYTGFRPKEVCNLLVGDVDAADWYVVGGMKTESGKNRTVPIHPSIRKTVEEAIVNSGTEFLFNHNGRQFSYAKYLEEFRKCCCALGIDEKHSPHDCRKQFVTMAKNANVNEYAIKRIIGHAITDLTENVYTDRSKEWLMSEVCKIP